MNGKHGFLTNLNKTILIVTVLLWTASATAAEPISIGREAKAALERIGPKKKVREMGSERPLSLGVDGRNYSGYHPLYTANVLALEHPRWPRIQCSDAIEAKRLRRLRVVRPR